MNNDACLQSDKLFNLSGRVALLTGAAGHLGTEMAQALAGAGAHVILNGINAAKLHELELNLKAKDYSVSSLAFDVSDSAARADGIRKIAERFGKLDILINNAAKGFGARFDEATPAQFQEAHSIIVEGAFFLVQEASELLKNAAKVNFGGASVVNIASMYGSVSPDSRIYGETGFNSPPSYGAAKAGLVQLSRYLACELARYKIRVNSLSPGPFPRPELARTQPEFFKNLCEKNPMGRVGRAAELKGPILFLASDASSYVTGINLPVDGGWTAW